MAHSIGSHPRSTACSSVREGQEDLNGKEIDGLAQRVSQLFPVFPDVGSTQRAEPLIETTEATRSNPNPDSKKEAFEKLTKYLPNKEAVLREGLERQEEIEYLCLLLDKGDWKAIETTYKDSWDYLAKDALCALDKEKIALNQFCTVAFRWSLKVDFPDQPIRVIPVFNGNGEINSEAQSYIEDSFMNNNKRKSYLGKKQVEEFFKRVKMLPPSERVVFMFKSTCKDKNSVKNVLHGNGFRVLGRVTVAGIDYEIVSSLGMNQEFLHVYAKNTTPFIEDVTTPLEAVKITPRIGMSSADDIAQNGLDNTRDMYIPFLGVEVPKIIDHVRSYFATEAWEHDKNHAVLTTNIPRDSKIAYIALGQAAKKLSEKEQNPEIREFLEVLYETIIDMSFEVYFGRAPVKSRNPAHLMLYVLCGFDNIESTTPNILFTSMSSIFYFTRDSLLNSAFREHYQRISQQQSSGSTNPKPGNFEIALKYLSLLIEHDIIEKIVQSLDPSFFENMGLSEEVLQCYIDASSRWQERCKNSLQEFTRIKQQDDGWCLEHWPSEYRTLVTYQGEEMTIAELWIRLFANSYPKFDFATQIAKSLNKLKLTDRKI